METNQEGDITSVAGTKTYNLSDLGNVKNLQTLEQQPKIDLNSLVASLNTNAMASTGEETKTTNEIDDLMKQLLTEGTEKQTLQTNLGIDTSQKELNELKKIANQQTADYIASTVRAEGARNIRQETNVAQQNIKRQRAIDVVLSNALISAKEGDIQYAQGLIDKAISAKYDPIKQAIENKKFLLTQISTKASRDQTNLLNAQLKQIEKNEKDDTLIQSMLMEASSMKAPPLVLKNANDLIAKGGTPAQVAQALGAYTGASAKAELLSEQIKTEKAQREKINADIEKTKSETPNSKSPEAVKKSLTQFSLLKDTASNAIKLSSASGRSIASEFVRKLGTSATQKEQLKNFADTLRTNVLTLAVDPNIKKFFGPQMTENDVRMMTAGGTTLNPDSQTPEQFKEEANRILEMFNRAEKAILQGTKEGQYVNTVVENSLNNTKENKISEEDYANSLIINNKEK